MELEFIDYIFWGFITLVVVGGVVCLIVLLPREHDLEDRTRDSYRIMYRDGSYSISRKKASLGENVFSIRSKYFYIKKSPFKVEAFCDEADAADGKNYRATAEMTVYFPEDRLNVFAPNFHGLSHVAVLETVSETVSAALTEAMREYDAGSEDAKKFEEHLKEVTNEKLKLFGLIVMSMKNLKIGENKQ